MQNPIQGIVAVVGRLALTAVFLMSAVGNKIPNFSDVAAYMGSKNIPAPKILLAGAIAFLIVGSLSIIVGYKARFGATLLFVFLVLVTYYFHNAFAIEDPDEKQAQMIQLMKNLALMGAMLFIMANGAGVASVDHCRAKANDKPDT